MEFRQIETQELHEFKSPHTSMSAKPPKLSLAETEPASPTDEGTSKLQDANIASPGIFHTSLSKVF